MTKQREPRVYCLYRVSSKKQVNAENNDIPMQRTACRDYCKQRGWTVVKEFEEKGISGYKVSANDRDAIQNLRDAALHEEFDILLVFMFDRLGRIDDETPFVLQWFCKQGVQVWSVMEGEQKFEQHIDKLTNFLRFWQASGESEKTSMRIKERKQQLTREGCYTGGPVPFGYHRVPNGRLNKHGTPLHDLVVHETEAAMVRMIFQKSVHEGMGSHRMAEWLNEQGLRTHSGAKFRALAVLRILRNRIYCGYLVAGEMISPQMEQLRIIEWDEFERAQVILQQRHEVDDEKRHISMRVKGQAMLSGNLFCSHCGGRITTSRYQDRKVRKDGTEYVADHMRYTCYHRTRNLCKCDGQATFKAGRVDEMVSNIIREIFSHMQGAPREEKLKAMLKRQEAGFMANRRKVSLELERNETQLTKLQDEIGKALLGQSAYSTDDLSQAITTLKAKISEGRVQLEMLSDEHTQQEHAVQSITPAYTQFKSWAEEFDGASMEKRKMIACQLFTRIELGKNYSIAVTLNMTYQQFCEEWEGLSERMASMS